LRSDADPGEIGYAYGGCFESVLRGKDSPRLDETGGTGQRERGQKPPPAFCYHDQIPPLTASHLELAFDLVDKAPIGAVGNDLLWGLTR
jgi:hypothetical protein